MSNVRCSVDHCHNKTGKLNASLTCFTIPVDEATLEKWVQITDYPWKSGAKVCSEHFVDDDLITTKSNGVRLKRGAIPTIVPAENLDQLILSQEPTAKKPRLTISRKSIAKPITMNLTESPRTASPEFVSKPKVNNRKSTIKKSGISDASSSTPIISGRKSIRSPNAVASNHSNDSNSTVQFHDQFLGFVNKTIEPTEVAPTSSHHSHDLSDYSSDEDDNKMLLLLHQKIDRLEASVCNVVAEIRAVRNDIKIATATKLAKKSKQNTGIAMTPSPRRRIANQPEATTTPSVVASKFEKAMAATRKSSTRPRQNDAKNKTITDVISCFPIDVAEFLDLNKLCSENERLRQFMLDRFNACTETDLTVFIKHNLKSIVIESNLRVLNWNSPNNGGAPAIRDCPIVRLLQESAVGKIANSSAAVALMAIKNFFVK